MLKKLLFSGLGYILFRHQFSAVSFEELKFLFLLLLVSVFLVIRKAAPGRSPSRILVLFVFLMAGGIAGAFRMATEHPERKASLLAGTETLTAQKVDSLIQAQQVPAESLKHRKQLKKHALKNTHEGINPKVGFSLLFLLGLAMGVGAFYLGLAFIFFSFTFIVPFLFFVLSAVFLAGAFYFLNRIFRKDPPKPLAERTPADRRKEWKRFGSNFLVSLVVVGISLVVLFTALMAF